MIAYFDSTDHSHHLEEMIHPGNYEFHVRQEGEPDLLPKNCGRFGWVSKTDCLTEAESVECSTVPIRRHHYSQVSVASRFQLAFAEYQLLLPVGLDFRPYHPVVSLESY